MTQLYSHTCVISQNVGAYGGYTIKEAQAFFAVVFTLAPTRFPSPQLSQPVNPTSSPLLVFLLSGQQEEPANASSQDGGGGFGAQFNEEVCSMGFFSVSFLF
jgi:hypothetical protein